MTSSLSPDPYGTPSVDAPVFTTPRRRHHQAQELHQGVNSLTVSEEMPINASNSANRPLHLKSTRSAVTPKH